MVGGWGGGGEEGKQTPSHQMAVKWEEIFTHNHLKDMHNYCKAELKT